MLAFFPKVGVQLPANLEVYGGALLALAPAPIADPFHTKTNGGGEAYNALNQAAGNDYGVEIDVGVRWHTLLGRSSALWVGAEAGVLLPGSALAGLEDPVHGARLTVSYTPYAAQK